MRSKASLRISLIVRLLIAAHLPALVSTAVAQEICGLQNVVYDSIFKNGFDVPLAASGDLGPPLGTVPVPSFGIAPTLSVTDPLPSANVGFDSIAVVGTYTGPTATGVSVNGVPAVVQNGAFVVPKVSLVNGSNTLHATVTTLDGLTATTTVNVSYSPGTSGVGLASDASVGPAPMNIGFNVIVPSAVSVQTFSFDYGDGSPPYTGSVGAVPRHTYATAGVYQPTATIVDPQHNTYMTKTGVGIYSVPQIRSQVCSVYAFLRARLNASDAPNALMVFDENARIRYNDFLTAPGVNLPSVASALGTLAAGTFAPTFAELTTVHFQNGVLEGTTVRFSQSSDGVWRIESM